MAALPSVQGNICGCCDRGQHYICLQACCSVCAVEEGEEGARLLLAHFVAPLGRLTAFVLRFWPHLQAAKSGAATCLPPLTRPWCLLMVADCTHVMLSECYTLRPHRGVHFTDVPDLIADHSDALVVSLWCRWPLCSGSRQRVGADSRLPGHPPIVHHQVRSRSVSASGNRLPSPQLQPLPVIASAVTTSLALQTPSHSAQTHSCRSRQRLVRASLTMCMYHCRRCCRHPTAGKVFADGKPISDQIKEYCI